MSENMIPKEHTQSFRVCRAQDQSSPSSSSNSVSPPVPRHNVVNIHPLLPSYHSISQHDDVNNIQHVYKVKARCLQDPVTGVHQTFILWSDVRVLVKDAEYALDGDGSLIPFIIDDNCEELIPRRIMCHPDRVLEVVVSTTAPLGTGLINDAVNSTRQKSKLEMVLTIVAVPLCLLTFGLTMRIIRS
ncbi:MAG: hypothetical protein JOS17DRAFT_197205 [Linnemannia elongata]|nr:MAG: hypothetical protein JOS17DRAFT_197205 [Linnemannia elongata]